MSDLMHGRMARLADDEGKRTAAAEQAQAAAQKLIADHNAECDALCTKQAENCLPYTSRGRKCPECPRDWKIDAIRAISPEVKDGVNIALHIGNGDCK